MSLFLVLATSISCKERLEIVTGSRCSPRKENRNRTVFGKKGENGLFTVAGQTITWNAANAGYDLETTDVVTVIYAT